MVFLELWCTDFGLQANRTLLVLFLTICYTRQTSEKERLLASLAPNPAEWLGYGEGLETGHSIFTGWFMADQNRKLIFTIGHSNQDSQRFLQLLTNNLIQILVDVRSSPHSRFASQFDVKNLKKALSNKGIKYLYMGSELGGKPSDPFMYDKEGHALYHLMAQSPLFLRAVQRLLKGLESYRIAVMCSEEDPSECHRHLLIGRVIRQHGVEVVHIRADGRVQTDEQLEKARAQESIASPQLAMFSEQKGVSWRSTKSIRSASRNGAQRSFSKPSRKPE